MEDDSFHELRAKLMDKFLVQPTLSTPNEKSTVDWHCLLPKCKENSKVFKRRDGWIAHHASQHSASRNDKPYPTESEAKQFVREDARRRQLHPQAARGRNQATTSLPLALSTFVAPTPLDTAPPPPAPGASIPLDTAAPLALAAPKSLDSPSPPPPPAAPTPLETTPPAPAPDRRRLHSKAFRGAKSEDWHCIEQLIRTHRRNGRAIQRMTTRNEQIVEELGNHFHLAFKRKRNTVDEPELSLDSPDSPAERAEDPPADQAEPAPIERAEDSSAERAEDPPEDRTEDPPAERGEDSLPFAAVV